MCFGCCGLGEDEEDVEEVELKGRVGFLFIFGNVVVYRYGVGEVFFELNVDFGFKEVKVVVVGLLLMGSVGVDILIGLVNVFLVDLLIGRNIFVGGGGVRIKGFFCG